MPATLRHSKRLLAPVQCSAVHLHEPTLSPRPLSHSLAHLQDLTVTTPWTLITTQFNFTGAQAGRKLKQAGSSAGAGAGNASGNAGSAAVPANGAAAPNLTLPANSSIIPSYDVDQTKLGGWVGCAVASGVRALGMCWRRTRWSSTQFG